MLTAERVYELIREQLGSRKSSKLSLTEDSTMDDVGLSSLQVADIMFTIEEDLGFELDLAAASNASSIGELVELANRQASVANTG